MDWDCHVIYCDSLIHQEKYLTRSDLESSAGQPISDNDTTKANVAALASLSEGIHILQSGPACLGKIKELEIRSSARVPCFIFARCSTSSSGLATIHLIHQQQIKGSIGGVHASFALVDSETDDSISMAENNSVRRDSLRRSFVNIQEEFSTDACVAAGAADIYPSPITLSETKSLEVHLSRARLHLQYKSANRSSITSNAAKPHLYLRAPLVSHLLHELCIEQPFAIRESGKTILATITPERQQQIRDLVGTWQFSTHGFTPDELVFAAFTMLKHVIDMPELAKWKIKDHEICTFLIYCRHDYNPTVRYHNFHHVIDVLQAVFFFLLSAGAIPQYPGRTAPPKHSLLSSLLQPFDVLVLLVTAIGHDVGHPGVNNSFLVAMKAPIAQLYNDQSVLEAFHCALYSQICRLHWPAVASDLEFRKLMIKCILATDMQLHFKYMSDMEQLHKKVQGVTSLDEWSKEQKEDVKVLLCGLLIKCADISNVARPFDVAKEWSFILQMEFARQGEMELDVGIPTQLFGGPPEVGNLIKHAKSQTTFANVFAKPLFAGMNELLPGMQFTCDEIAKNKVQWEKVIDETALSESTSDDTIKAQAGEEPVGSPVTSHPEGLPATGQESASAPKHDFVTGNDIAEVQHPSRPTADINSEPHPPTTEPETDKSKPSIWPQVLGTTILNNYKSKRHSNSTGTEYTYGAGDAENAIETPATTDSGPRSQDGLDSRFPNWQGPDETGTMATDLTVPGTGSTNRTTASTEFDKRTPRELDLRAVSGVNVNGLDGTEGISPSSIPTTNTTTTNTTPRSFDAVAAREKGFVIEAHDASAGANGEQDPKIRKKRSRLLKWLGRK